MAVIINETFRQKAEALKKPLLKNTVHPESIINITKDENCFQNLKADIVQKNRFPAELKSGDEIIFDFGKHITGYLSFTLENDGLIKITDSPIKLNFSFGEFLFDTVADPAQYSGGLGNGWLQTEERSYVFTPCRGTLERRYSFRYLRIKRTDSASFPVLLTSLEATAVSAVDISNAKKYDLNDQNLQKIYDMSVYTLKECEQDVFEDGPKRDRRLWIGDLKLQAMTDYKVFGNLDLIKRCIYLFASATGEHGMVAPCIFPDSPPYVDEWTFCDYSLYFISCLYDWYKNTGDISLVDELYETAKAQMVKISEHFSAKDGTINLRPFIDWCPGLDKGVSVLGVYIYTLKQLKEIEAALGKDTEETEKEIKSAANCLLSFYDEKQGLFSASSGQISQHSQVWAVLSGEIPEEKAKAILIKTKDINTPFTMRTPYMMHYYIEALYNCRMKAQALEFIRDYWGKIAAAGYDCCPEVFNPQDEWESPYGAPEINSACHAWSCTPAYWLPKLINI